MAPEAAMSSRPIADHALLSDRHSAALVTSDGSVDWLAFPRFDSPSVLGRLLDDEAGHWSIRPPVSGSPVAGSRRYLDRTMVLETTFRTESGILCVTDALAVGPDNHGHDLGAGAPHCLIRRVSCSEGEVAAEVEFVPRPEYGLVHPLLSSIDVSGINVSGVEGGVLSRGGADTLVLTAPCTLRLEAASARGTLRLEAGDARHFCLHWAPLGQPARVWEQDELAERLDATIEAWRSWSRMHQSYEGEWDQLVQHSGRVLQALSYQPTGAIVAAATTSLPELVGGGRNWDYRYTWVRDASFTMQALWVAACPDEAEEFFSFMTTAAAGSVVHRGLPLQIMFGVGGERDLSERSLPHLAGWRGSAPVRVGNGAWNQAQVDVYGELLGAAHQLREQLAGGPSGIDSHTRAFLAALADTAAMRWQEKDQGIWEVRGDAQHFLYSKLMCWVALDRAVELAGELDAQDRVTEWESSREQIRAAIERDGWNEQAQAFTQAFGSEQLDASNLMLVIVGFLPPDDPRIIATVEATEQRLTDERGLVYRYRTEGGADGLDGDEGTFLLCTFWLAQANALLGRLDRARAAFELAISFANVVGLLAEEVDSATGELLGNFPQAFSHIGLINAAYAISMAADRA